MRAHGNMITIRGTRSILLLALATVIVPRAYTAEPGFPAFPILESELTLHAEATSRRFIAAHGQRGMIAGYAAENLEGWIYPFRIFHDFRVSFRGESDSQVMSGSGLVREVVVNPESVTRIYSAQNFTVRETLFVPLELAGFAILYEVESRNPLHILISFRPDLDLMWPGGIGGQSYDWDAGRHAFVLQESSGRYSALVGSPAAGRHAAPAAYPEPWDTDRRLSLELDAPATTGQRRYYPLVAACTIPDHYDGRKIYDQLLQDTARLYAETVEHYRKLVGGHLQVKTPDPRANLAYSWARIAVDQAWVCNPWLGCGLVAGYGPSRDTRRSQYAWFFGGDALINTWALESVGEHQRARDAVRFIQKYQKKESGEVFHEISQSAGLIDWFKDYPYGYRHTDASALYLVAARNLYRSSGDAQFVRSGWGSLRASYGFLVSRLDPADGLVTVPPGGWGGDETIGEQVSKDIYLESLWVAGAQAFSELAKLMGEAALADEALDRAKKAQASIDQKLWSAERNFFFYGFNSRGDLLTQELGQPNWGIWLGVFDRERSERALNYMSRANWIADWGLRSIPSGGSVYIGDSYGHGSVWPLGTGIQTLVFYRFHRPLQAYSLWQASLEQTFLNSLGHVTEVFSGDFYRELDVSVPEQIWSSGMVITSLVRGLLGLEPDAPASKLVWTPHLPADWPNIKLDNLRIGQSTLNLGMEQSETEVKLRIENSGPAVEVEFAPEIPLGAKNVKARQNGKPIPISCGSYAQDAHAQVKFRVDDAAEVVIGFDPGIRPWLPSQRLQMGDASRGLRILSSSLQGRSYRAEVEGVPGACSSLMISTPWQVRQVNGGELRSHKRTEWEFVVSPTPDSCATDSAYKSWTFEVEFATAPASRPSQRSSRDSEAATGSKHP